MRGTVQEIHEGHAPRHLAFSGVYLFLVVLMGGMGDLQLHFPGNW